MPLAQAQISLPSGPNVGNAVGKTPGRLHSSGKDGLFRFASRTDPQMPHSAPSYFHLHLVSDSTGETLSTIAKAASVQYAERRPLEHIHPMVRTSRQVKRLLQEIEQAPGIVLYTIVNTELADLIEQRCRELKVPCHAVLKPVLEVFESYLGAPQKPTVAGQHVLDADYYRRIDALNFTMAHDDGRGGSSRSRRILPLGKGEAGEHGG